jgi:DNA-binding CsgD family transcriptional regulator
MCLILLGITALERGDPERAAPLYEEDVRILQSLKDKPGTVYGLSGLAGVAALRGDAVRAARLWGSAEALRAAIGYPLSIFDLSHPDYEGLLDASCSRLGDATWASALAEGRTMTPEQAIEYALESLSEMPKEAEAPPAYPAGLSAREIEVLKLVARGMTNVQVATELFVSPRTVNARLGSIYHKIGSHSRAQAARFASEHGLL